MSLSREIHRASPPQRRNSMKARRKIKSANRKRPVVIAGHKTNVSLEDAFWDGLKKIAGGLDMTLSELVTEIDSDRRRVNLSSAIRVFVLEHYRRQIGGQKQHGSRA
jgi:predicted DNA-binding ribbon-helix-helix protein